MRTVYSAILMGCLLTPVVFASLPDECLTGIPDDDNYIVSGKLLRGVTQCLDNFIIKTLEQQLPSIIVTDGQTLAATKFGCSSYLQSNVYKASNVFSTIYIQFINKIIDEKTIHIITIHHSAKDLSESRIV